MTTLNKHILSARLKSQPDSACSLGLHKKIVGEIERSYVIGWVHFDKSAPISSVSRCLKQRQFETIYYITAKRLMSRVLITNTRVKIRGKGEQDLLCRADEKHDMNIRPLPTLLQ